MRTILFIIQKEFLQILRDIRMIPIIFISPVFQLILLGYAANLDAKNIPIVVCDADHTVESRELTQSMINAHYFIIKETISDTRMIDPIINQGRASLALVIPRGFSSGIKKGETAHVQLLVDGSDSNTATIALNYATMIVSSYSGKIIAQRLIKTGGGIPLAVSAETRIWYNPNLESRNFMVPGILAMLLMLMTMLLTSMSVVKEREIGTMEQLSVTPIRPYQLIIGKLTPFIIISFIDVMLILLASAFVFNIPIKGSIIALFVLSSIFLLSTLGLGLFISTISHDQQQAMFSAMFFVMVPMIILSGFVFPIENMPPVIQYITLFMPLRYYFIIVRGLFLKGADFIHLWKEALSLFTIGIVILIISALRVKKRVK
ncbi:MAG: ABC transporter permease [Spirochaetales bacterium]|nr:ABC transporter permease [Spirochaetales bacterium]